ncbi:MAG TPA: acetylglutamate kinase [Bacteroidales bacterium]|nr:acetylglutamate kinase [Bacteroidales bacterium]
MDQLTVLKIGGNILDNEAFLENLLDSFSLLQGKKILVHGGGKIANVLMEKLGIAPKMVEGRRITDEETLKIVTMVYAGLINKNLVAQLQKRGCESIGLTGADANIIPAVKRPAKEVDYGFVGDVYPKDISSNTIINFLSMGLVPVCAPITHNGEGDLLNTNADTIASSVAIALAPFFHVNLVYCFEKNGVLMNPADENSVISRIDMNAFTEYKASGVISAGMIPKLDNAFAAINSGVKQVTICGPAAFRQDKPVPGTVIIQ